MINYNKLLKNTNLVISRISGLDDKEVDLELDNEKRMEHDPEKLKAARQLWLDILNDRIYCNALGIDYVRLGKAALRKINLCALRLAENEVYILPAI